jgi:putative adhesin
MMHTFNTPNPIHTAVDVPGGHIRFIAADRTDTTIEVRPADATKGRDVKAAERTTIELHDGTLRVVTPTKYEAFGPSGAIEVTVQLPAGSSVEVSGSAELRGVGRLGDVIADSSYGAIKLDEAASARLATQGGDVSVGRLTGPAEITTAKGDIRIAEAVRGSLVLSTQMGDVTVAAAAGVSASLDAGTGYGRVSNALKNDGTADLEIRATTSYGDITARSL